MLRAQNVKYRNCEGTTPNTRIRAKQVRTPTNAPWPREGDHFQREGRQAVIQDQPASLVLLGASNPWASNPPIHCSAFGRSQMIARPMNTSAMSEFRRF